MKVTVLGVPSSAGAYCVGVERAPAALREAGLVEGLRSAGAQVVDAGHPTTRLWRPDRDNPFAQNLDVEAEAVVELSTAAAGLLADGERLLVLGGSCMVAVGMCAALAHAGQRPRLVYVDRHLDLNTPDSTTEGSLSWMGMAHALALEGAVPELVDATGHAPLLHHADLVHLGPDTTRETTGNANKPPGSVWSSSTRRRCARTPGAQHAERSAPSPPVRSSCTSMSTSWTSWTRRSPRT